MDLGGVETGRRAIVLGGIGGNVHVFFWHVFIHLQQTIREYHD
jgi:hypothetical protein